VGASSATWELTPPRGSFLIFVGASSGTWELAPARGSFLIVVGASSGTWELPHRRGSLLRHVGACSATWELPLGRRPFLRHLGASSSSSDLPPPRGSFLFVVGPSSSSSELLQGMRKARLPRSGGKFESQCVAATRDGRQEPGVSLRDHAAEPAAADRRSAQPRSARQCDPRQSVQALGGRDSSSRRPPWHDSCPVCSHAFRLAEHHERPYGPHVGVHASGLKMREVVDEDL
jgi:hypothetical protein